MARIVRGRGGGGVLGGLRRLLVTLVVLLVVVPPLWVLLYRFVPPPLTVLMVERLVQGQGLDHRWVPLKRISPALTRAVIAS